jgi:hypothetical protein
MLKELSGHRLSVIFLGISTYQFIFAMILLGDKAMNNKGEGAAFVLTLIITNIVNYVYAGLAKLLSIGCTVRNIIYKHYLET